MTITTETVLAKITNAGKSGYRPIGGEAKIIFALSNAGVINAVTHKSETGGMHIRYVVACP
jgi:hypothetical protein